MIRMLSSAVLGIAVCAALSFAQAPNAEQKAKIDARIKMYAPLGTDATLVAEVKKANATPQAEAVGMTQDKWKELTILSPEVKAFTKNALGTYIKTKKDEVITEIFVSCADGTKAAFTNKTSGWSHKGKPKHDVPMTGKTWSGSIEVDESTGKQQVQIAVPVLDGGKAIGSIVIGLDVSKM